MATHDPYDTAVSEFDSLRESDGSYDQTKLALLARTTHRQTLARPDDDDLCVLAGTMLLLLDEELFGDKWNVWVAKECFLRAIAINDKNDDAWTELGFVYDIEMSLILAQHAFRRALSIDGLPDTYAGLARVEAQLGNRAVALELLRNGIERFPEKESLKERLAEIESGEWAPLD